MVAGFFKRFFVFRNYLIAAALGVMILTFFAKQYAFFPFDLYITKSIQQINFPFFRELMLSITWLGNFYPTIVSVTLVCTVLLYLKRKDLSAGLFLSSAGAVAISETIKQFVSRPRPDATLIIQIEKFMKDDSFPSGHVMYFMGFYGFLLFASFVLIRSRKWRNIISGVFLALIILIGISRIYKGSHWFSDTLASYLIGSIWLYLVIFVYQKLVKKKEIEPKEINIPRETS